MASKQAYLWEAFLAQERDDGLPAQLAGADEAQHGVKVTLGERLLE